MLKFAIGRNIVGGDVSLRCMDVRHLIHLCYGRSLNNATVRCPKDLHNETGV